MASTELPETLPPGPHHLPPEELNALLPLKVTEQSWVRSHPAGLEPLYSGRSGHNRFDAPNGEFGTLYVGQDEHCAFVETFGHETGVADFVTTDALRSRELSRIDPGRSLRLVDLSGSGLARLGADARLTTGSIAISQRWAQAFRDHPDRPDGLYYRSRHDPDRFCAAIFDRSLSVLASTSLGTFADASNRKLLAQILDTYAFGLIDS